MQCEEEIMHSSLSKSMQFEKEKCNVSFSDLMQFEKEKMQFLVRFDLLEGILQPISFQRSASPLKK